LAFVTAALCGQAAPAAPPALGEADQPCAGCHEQTIDTASFASSVHAPMGCAACHSIDLQQHPGDVAQNRADRKPPAHAAGTCLTCHEGTASVHVKWLPNAGTHLAVVSCAACHAQGAKRRVELRLYDTRADREVRIAGKTDELLAGDAPFDNDRIGRLVDAVDNGTGRVMLVGRVEVDLTDLHRLGRKADAVKECATCHRKGADAFGQVSLSLVGSDGNRVQHAVGPEVLHAPISIDTVRGFYALGGTRIHAFDVLLGLAVLGGVSAPIGHAVMRKLMRRKERNDA
jgi:hypothetical protein